MTHAQHREVVQRQPHPVRSSRLSAEALPTCCVLMIAGAFLPALLFGAAPFVALIGAAAGLVAGLIMAYES